VSSTCAEPLFSFKAAHDWTTAWNPSTLSPLSTKDVTPDRPNLGSICGCLVPNWCLFLCEDFLCDPTRPRLPVFCPPNRLPPRPASNHLLFGLLYARCFSKFLSLFRGRSWAAFPPTPCEWALPLPPGPTFYACRQLPATVPQRLFL